MFTGPARGGAGMSTFQRKKLPQFTITEQQQMEVTVVDGIVPEPPPRWADEFAKQLGMNGIPAKLEKSTLTFKTRESDYERVVAAIDLAIANTGKALDELRQRANAEAEAAKTREQIATNHQVRLAEKFRGK